MPRLGPIKRKDLVRYFKELGFEGPYWLPNPHEGDIGRDFLARILRQASIERDEWDAL
jgi:predicted RNA binding protein YcfA (HicA-like mRNA interferase family)